MEMKRSICMHLLILVLLELVLLCQGCWKHEREALLMLKARMGNSLPWPEGNDCCRWTRVECNTTTGRVTELLLYSVVRGDSLGDWYLNFSDFKAFEDLKSLYLYSNHITGCVENQGLSLSNLEVLYLSFNSLNHSDASIRSCLDGLSSLKYLSLDSNGLNLNETSLYGLSSMLINLGSLNIGGNNFNDIDIGSSLSGLSSLNSLSLGNSQLSPRSIRSISKLRSLETLDLYGNNLKNLTLWSLLLEKEGFAWPTNLKSLDLSNNKLEGSVDIRGLLALSNLEILDLSHNNISNFVVHQEKEEFAWPTNLKVLRLRGNRISNDFLQVLGLMGLQNLKSLDLWNNQLEGSVDIRDWSQFTKLEELDLSHNKFDGPLPSSFCNMTSLRKLDLQSNNFTGNISNIACLTSLEYLDVEDGNQFEFPISFTPFANHSNLKFIYGNGNKVILDSHATSQTWVPNFQLQVLRLSSTTVANSLPLPNFLLYQYNLTTLEFTGCKSDGEFPNWLLENNTKMTHLVLRFCSFTGTFQLPSHPFLSVKKIDVSNNAITGQIPSKNISSIFPNLLYLDMSDNLLSGEIPKNISGDMPLLWFLKLSNNKLDGPIFPALSKHSHLEQLYLDGNSLSGSIPSSFFNTSFLLSALDISNNHFVGRLPRIKSLSSLKELYMSNNHFEGSIPSEFGEIANLSFLDLSQNNLTGSVPSFLNHVVYFINLSNNKLSGLPKIMFPESSSILLLDLSYNQITKGIQDMIQDLSHTRLKILLLKGNRFTEQIPKQLCQLTNISIIDLSHNKFSGPIPSCLGKMPFESPLDLLGFLSGFTFIAPQSTDIETIPYIKEKANFTTKKRSESYTGSGVAYMTGIDLSCNRLNGNIPSELGNLTKLRALNLSHNDLRGKIPATFSNLRQIESLDLSYNILSGNIPPQLNELTSLEVFSVAHNNLSGATLERKGQFGTFDEENSYDGNPFLCGPPLPKSCNPPDILPNGYIDEGNGSLADMSAFYVTFVVAYISILLVIAATLYINPYWRRAWFYYIELVSMNCYFFIEDNLCKFPYNGNM